MLDAQFTNALRFLPRTVRDAFGWPGPLQEQDFSAETAASLDRSAMSADDEFPSIVRKAQDDVHWRKALTRLGYNQVRSAYARHRQEGLDVFQDLGQERSRPPMDFVRDWLKEERRRIVARVQWSFVVAMLATILAGATFVATIALLG